MESPVRGIRFIHQAINCEAAELEKQAQLGGLDPARVAFFKRVLHLHAMGEEKALFPIIEQRARGVVPAYLMDHRAEEKLLAELDGPYAARTATLLAEHLRLHILKEDEILVPLLELLLTPEEQAQHVAHMMSTFTPADMAELGPWMITWLSPDDRRAYLALVERGLPPERFSGLLAMLRAKLAPDVWETLGR